MEIRERGEGRGRNVEKLNSTTVSGFGIVALRDQFIAPAPARVRLVLFSLPGFYGMHVFRNVSKRPAVDSDGILATTT